MNSVEKTARSVDEAIEEALAELGVGRDEVEIEVIERPKGFLGIFSRESATVRVTVKSAAEAAVAEQAERAPTRVEELEPEARPLSELADKALGALTKTLELMGVNASAEVQSADDECVRINISGPDVALLIGRHGDTLDALQLITALIATRQTEQRGRIVLDAENYRERRKEMLENMAHSHAQKAKRTRQEVVLLDLKPYERRIIHLALVDDPHVSTYSEGQGAGRRLVISPVDGGEDSA